jgi:hypothetical protein
VDSPGGFVSKDGMVLVLEREDGVSSLAGDCRRIMFSII